jgi:hypothetical protein
VLYKPQSECINAIALNNDGSVLAVGLGNGKLVAIDLMSQDCKPSVTTPEDLVHGGFPP